MASSLARAARGQDYNWLPVFGGKNISGKRRFLDGGIRPALMLMLSGYAAPRISGGFKNGSLARDAKKQPKDERNRGNRSVHQTIHKRMYLPKWAILHVSHRRTLLCSAFLQAWGCADEHRSTDHM